jgi:CDP-glycerol glycerophosphotransferase (TagB/SpsB family)/glycosyltransferase involved in cell wall biosynthesis
VVRLRRAAKFEVHAFWRRRPIKPNVVLYESFAGNGMLCNPEAIFRGLRAEPEFAHLRHVWVLRSKRENRTVVREFRHDRSVCFVRPRSLGYYRALATSGYLINNATFPIEFGKRDGQIYLNTWHGTPLKRMGYDIGDPASRVGNVIRNFLGADYLLAANEFMREQMYESAHLLRQIYRGRIIIEGYPRIDHQFVDPAQAENTRLRLEDAGVRIGDRQIILYAPTWKGTSFNRPEDDADELISRVAELESRIDSSRYVVLLKTHQVVHKYAAHLPHLRDRLIPNEIPTNVVLGATDLLITDYSSIFFDFLATGRPIMFLTPDISDYAGYRGLYMEPATWPGPVVCTVEELATEINALVTTEPSAELVRRYEAMRTRFTSLEDGNATARVIDIVFRGQERGYAVTTATSDGRPSILINGGGMRPNGITTSLLNLLDTIDHDRFDVTVAFNTSYRKLVLGKQRQINPRVRQLSRVGGMNGSKLTHLGRRASWLKADLRSHTTNPAQRRLWDEEWTRCFGSSRFDYVIDFSGYGPFWATLMLHAPGSRRAIWMHNDLAADAHRETNGKRRHLRDLTGVFSLYAEYDRLVSVSPSLATINRESLSSFARPEKFVSALNLVNARHVLGQASVDLGEAVADPATGELPEWARELVQRPDVATFITVGRLSSEKNQARLIRAFAIVHATTPATRLVIVGHGPLFAELEQLIAELGLDGVVWLVGHQTNPYALMAVADCFVLSSNYEGQPMVLLEALIVGLPVVTVDFRSAHDALPDGAAAIVAATDEALAAGMNEYLSGSISAGAFDATSYNAAAINQFYEAIEVGAVVP